MTRTSPLANLKVLIETLLEILREEIPLRVKLEKLRIFVAFFLTAPRRNAQHRKTIAAGLQLLSLRGRDYLLYAGDGWLVAKGYTLWIDLTADQLPAELRRLIPRKRPRPGMAKYVPVLSEALHKDPCALLKSGAMILCDRPCPRLCQENDRSISLDVFGPLRVDAEGLH